MPSLNLRPALLALAATAGLLAVGCASMTTRTQTAMLLDQELAGPQRTEAERARDAWRHPKETLLFFGLRPEMTVVEITPGAGWYMKVIAPLLREQGRYIAALPATGEGQIVERQLQQFNALVTQWPEKLGKAEVAPFLPGQPIAPDGTADMVLTFRNIHSWMGRDNAAAAFESMYRVLKPGGVLGVVEHRGNPAVPQDPRAGSGYVNQEYAIRLIESAGFRLVATSEINANPKDTKDYPRGVWTLPPGLAEGDKDRARYEAIGESDRFTLKFVKPRT
jgi:predicted methyltransferase